MGIFEKSNWLKIFWRLLIIDIKILPRNLNIRYCNWRLWRIEHIKTRKGWHFVNSPEMQAAEKEAMNKFAAAFPGTTLYDFDSFLKSPPFFSLRFLKQTILGWFFK